VFVFFIQKVIHFFFILIIINNNYFKQLESACFFQSGDFVATSHSDGSFLLWDVENKDSKPVTQNVYGPYPCRPISKIMVKTVKK
jgi:WD40 repeat protein